VRKENPIEPPPRKKKKKKTAAKEKKRRGGERVLPLKEETDAVGQKKTKDPPSGEDSPEGKLKREGLRALKSRRGIFLSTNKKREVARFRLGRGKRHVKKRGRKKKATVHF